MALTQHGPTPQRNDAAIAVGIAYLLIAIYWSLNATGLAFYTALLQERLLGVRYSPVLSVVMLWLPPVVAYALFAGRAVRRPRPAPSRLPTPSKLPARRVPSLTPAT